MTRPFDLTDDDLPVCAVLNPADTTMPVSLLDVHGRLRARFVNLTDAQRVVDEINGPQAPELMQSDIHDTGVEPAQEEQAQPKEKPMPRGVPKKKRATKKRKNVAPVVKKTAKKTMKKKKRARR